MAGVEILSQTEVIVDYSFGWLAFWITAMIGIGATLIGSMLFALLNSEDYGAKERLATFLLLFIVISCLMIALASLLGSTIFSDPLPPETHYKVTVDDSVFMKEFLDKYEILDQEGRIYTVRERTENE